jgi:hypothetical protein
LGADARKAQVVGDGHESSGSLFNNGREVKDWGR